MDDGVSHRRDAVPAGRLLRRRTAGRAVVLMHGLGGNREQMNLFLGAFGLAERDYAVLTIDARGHGQSGGLANFGGTRDVADARAVHAWLAARPDVADTRIGAWGISYGGGIVLNSLVAGVPWDAVATVESWTDLASALMPQGLVKSGLVTGLASSDPRGAPRPLGRRCLRGRARREHRGRAPVGRRALEPLEARRRDGARLHGPGEARLPLRGRPGHRGVSSGCSCPRRCTSDCTATRRRRFPAADTFVLVQRIKQWLDCHLRSLGCATAPSGVYLAPERFSGSLVRRTALPWRRPPDRRSPA